MIWTRIRLLSLSSSGMLAAGILAVCIAVLETTSAETPVSQVKQHSPVGSIQNRSMPGHGRMQADYDNDANLLVLRGAWLEKGGRHPDSRLRNYDDSTFTDVTFDSGLGEVHNPTETASWGNFNNDGNLDLYIGNETTEALKVPCYLFHNNGDGTFTDVAVRAGVQNHAFTKAVVWSDFDGDRWPDLNVSNFKGVNRLYHNNSNGTFTDLADQTSIASPIRSFPSCFWDFNNDGNQVEPSEIPDWRSRDVATTSSHQVEAEGNREPEFVPEFADYYNRGLDLLKSENYVGAVEALQRAIQVNPGSERAHYILGRIYLMNLAKTAAAVEELLTTIKLTPNNARAYQMLGVAYFKQNAFQEAIRPLRRAIELGAKVEEDYPYHPYYDLGMVYLKQNKFDDAIRCFEQAIQLHPDQIRTYYSLGNAYIRQGDVKKGAEHIRKYQALKPYLNTVSQLKIAVRRTPKSPERWYQLGRLHAQYSRFDKALKPLEKSIELNPNSWEVYNILAVCYMRLNQLDKMQQVCKAAVRLVPNEANAHNALGMSYFLQRKHLKAVSSFITAVGLDADNPEFHENLGKVYEALGEAEQAACELETARQLRAKHGKKRK